MSYGENMSTKKKSKSNEEFLVKNNSQDNARSRAIQELMTGDPDFKRRLLEHNQEQYKKDKQHRHEKSVENLTQQVKQDKKNAEYDKIINTDDHDRRPPVARKKRSQPYIDQMKRRKEAPETKIINRIQPEPTQKSEFIEKTNKQPFNDRKVGGGLNWENVERNKKEREKRGARVYEDELLGNSQKYSKPTHEGKEVGEIHARIHTATHPKPEKVEVRHRWDGKEWHFHGAKNLNASENSVSAIDPHERAKKYEEDKNKVKKPKTVRRTKNDFPEKLEDSIGTAFKKNAREQMEEHLSTSASANELIQRLETIKKTLQDFNQQINKAIKPGETSSNIIGDKDDKHGNAVVIRYHGPKNGHHGHQVHHFSINKNGEKVGDAHAHVDDFFGEKKHVYVDTNHNDTKDWKPESHQDWDDKPMHEDESIAHKVISEHMRKNPKKFKLTNNKSLKKGMNNSGLGGAGSIKSGASLPFREKPIKTNNNSLASKVKIPGISQKSKKNPVNVAEQTHNKDIKDIKMKEAQAALKVNAPHVIKSHDGLIKGDVYSIKTKKNCKI